jgi:hypothetical protein
MRAQETAQFDSLARDTAATVRATVRRWWLDGKDRPTLHIEAERTFVGARPVVVHFSVPLSKTRVPTSTRPPQMEVGVVSEPALRKIRTTRRKARAATRKVRSTARKTRSAARKTRATAVKTRARATKTRPAATKARSARPATTPQRSRQSQKRPRAVSKKTRRVSSRG